MWSRIHLIPVLQAEEDRDLVRRHWADKAREKELMGAETKVYNNDRCVFGIGEVPEAQRRASKADNEQQIRAPHVRCHTWRDHQVEQGRDGSHFQEGERTMLMYILWGLGRFSRRQPPADESIKRFRSTFSRQKRYIPRQVRATR